ncbi:MAG: NAD(P)/FAD-dependent oxidoreductase [Planctomycetota bacterium]
MSQIAVIGGGLSGLNCAKYLASAGNRIVLLEAASHLGGRVATDVLDGFSLDHGFQVLQTAYPEAQRTLDYQALDLVELEPGAVIWKNNKWQRMSDPWRRPRHAIATMFNDIGTIPDRWRLHKMKSDILAAGKGPFEDVNESQDIRGQAAQDSTTAEFLASYGFSEDFEKSFLLPWISGMFLETRLDTSAEYFKFVFRMLSENIVALPKRGMQAIPNQLAEGIVGGDLRLNCEVSGIEGYRVLLRSGETIEAEAVVLATQQHVAQKLLGGSAEEPKVCATTCIYFAAPGKPVAEKSLMLNADDPGPVNHVFIPTNTVANYSQSEKSLVSVNLVAEASSEFDHDAVLDQLHRWFGSQVDHWRLLKTFQIPYALPQQPEGFFKSTTPELPDGVFCCGDYLESGSIQGALLSGRKTAEQVLSFLGT